jgi:acyl carrier protein
VDIEQISKEIYQYLKNELNGGNDFDPETDIIETNMIDSVKMIKLISFLEKTFNVGIELEDVNAENFSLIATMSKFVKELMPS